MKIHAQRNGNSNQGAINKLTSRLTAVCIVATLLIVNCALSANAQSLRGSISPVVEVEEVIHLTYSVNSLEVETFTPPNITNLQQLSSAKASRNTTAGITTYTITLRALSAGTYTIPPASIIIDGKTIRSTPLKVTVTAAETAAMQQTARLIVRASLNTATVMQGQPALLTYHVLIPLGVTLDPNYNMSLPDFTNLHAQEIEQPRSQEYKLTKVGEHDYKQMQSRQFLLYPQTTGKLSIPPSTFHLAVIVRKADDLDTRLNGQSINVVSREVKSNALTLTTTPLPSPAPKNFGGAVGDMRITASLLSDNVSTDEATTLRVVVQGTGNLRLVNAPKITLPKNIEQYPPTTTDNISITTKGQSGIRTFDYHLVPQTAGTFIIPPIEFTCFSPSQNKYITERTKPITLKVVASDTATSDTIAQGQQVDTNGNSEATHWSVVTIIALLIISALTVIAYKRRKTKSISAEQALLQALDTLKDLPVAQAKSDLLWQTLAIVLHTERSKLNKNYVQQQLSAKSVSQETINRYLRTLEEIEQSLYAPI